MSELLVQVGDHDCCHRKASPTELVTAVRHAIESGIIEGAYVWDTDDAWEREQYKRNEGKWLIIPMTLSLSVEERNERP